jgi:hypothetical protein
MLSMLVLLPSKHQQTRPGCIGGITNHFIQAGNDLRHADPDRYMKNFFSQFR